MNLFSFALFILLSSSISIDATTSPTHPKTQKVYKTGKWTEDEDAQAKLLFTRYEFDSRKWKKMSQILGRRGKYIASHFHAKLLLSNTTIASKSPKYKNGKWTPEEDAQVVLLFNELEFEKNKWNKMSQIIGRRGSLIRTHYQTKLDPNTTGSNGFKTGKYSEDEDTQIKLLLGEFATNDRKWQDISKIMGRRKKHLKEHYFSMLDPNRGEMNWGNWTVKDESDILECVSLATLNKTNPKWSKLAESMMRTRMSVYSYYTHNMQRGARLMTRKENFCNLRTYKRRCSRKEKEYIELKSKSMNDGKMEKMVTPGQDSVNNQDLVQASSTTQENFIAQPQSEESRTYPIHEHHFHDEFSDTEYSLYSDLDYCSSDDLLPGMITYDMITDDEIKEYFDISYEDPIF